MWLLAVTTPLLIGDLVPEDCESWTLYITLLKICSIACSWNVKPSCISYLRILIEEHHCKFRLLYPDKTIIPKMHYMVHYPRQILKYGPLIRSWTMRYEAKLCVVKHAARHGNFKNICYTVAKRTQHAFCYFLNCGIPFLALDYETSNTFTEVQSSREPEIIRLYIQSLGLSLPESIVHPKWVKYEHFHLKKYAYLYLGNGEMYPNFGKIVDLFTLDTNSKTLYIVNLQKCETVYYDSHFGAYVVNLLSSFSCSDVSSLPGFPLLHSHRAFGRSEIFILLKQYV